MSDKLKPGQNTGKDGGIYREVGPRGGKTDNYTTVKDNQKLPLRKNRAIIGNLSI